MSALIIDSHCHLDDDRFDDDRDQVMQRAHEVGIQQLIIPATTRDRWPKVKRISEQYPGVFASYGLHPYFMSEHSKQDIELLDEWLQQESCVAVGECGLDFYLPNYDEKLQLEFFNAQLAVAANHKLPVIIHARKALDLVISAIRQSKVEAGVIHSFSGSLQQARQLVELGFKLGIAAPVAYERAKKLQQVVRKIDLEALMIETDAPDQAGPNHRGERNEPAFIIDHLVTIANLRGMAFEECAQQLARNCRQLFQLAT